MNIGEKTYQFITKDHKGNEVNLEKFKGKKVLLSFHPLAWTGICKGQMETLEELYSELGKLNTIPLGLSVDSMHSKLPWAKEMGLKHLQLLEDFWPHGGIAKGFGIFRETEGFSERANIIIDENQNIIFKKVYNIPEQPDFQEILDFLKK